MNLKQLIEQGNHALRASNWELALEHWLAVYDQSPDHQWAGVTVGLTLFRLNRFDEATQFLLGDIILYSERELAFVYLARISQVQEKWELNAQQWSIILHKFPHYEWGLQSYANALKQMGDLNKAERYFHMDIRKYCDHAWSYAQLIEIGVEKQQYKLAEKRLDTYAEQFPDHLDTYKALKKMIQDQHDIGFYNRVYKPSYFRVHFTSARQQRFMYALIPKIASTTIIVRLYTQLVGEKPPLRVPSKDMIAVFRDGRKLHRGRYNYFTFTIVRNPYTRALSAYLFIIKRPRVNQKFRKMLGFSSFEMEDVSFIDFLRRIRDIPVAEMNAHFCPQWYLLSLHQSARYDFIGRFECLEADLQAVFTLIGDDNDDMSKISRRPHATHAGKKLLQYYGEEEKALVAEIYADDFKYLGYGYDLDLA